MSLDAIRHDITTQKQNEIATVLQEHQRMLEALFLTTKSITRPHNSDHQQSESTTTSLLEFLSQNNPVQGRFFNDATLEGPSQDVFAIPDRAGPSTQSLAPRAPSRTSPARDLSAQRKSVDSNTRGQRAGVSPAGIIRSPSGSLQAPHNTSSLQSARHGSASVAPSPSGASTQLLQRTASQSQTVPNETTGQQTPTAGSSQAGHHQGQRPAKVIHLPPKEVQERHMRDIQKAQNMAHEREQKEDERAQLSLTVPPTEAPSSPSSTAGPGSTATSKLAPHSPDTSPEAEFALEEPAGLDKVGQIGDDGGPSVEDTDMNEFLTPDAQLLAEQQATKQQRDPMTAQDPNIDRGVDESQNVIKDVAKSTTVKQRPPKFNQRLSSFNAPDVTMEDRPALKTPAVTTPGPLPPLQTPTSETPILGRTTRLASGAIRQKSVSEILGELPKHQTPTTANHSRASSTHLILNSNRSRRSVPATPSEERSKHSLVVFSKREKEVAPRGVENELDGYMALKGTSLDGERDYMKPLFMNQAYQMPRAMPLTELVHSANKTLTTSNIQVTQREHIEYRILRRIYQLQNSNRWALRQMAKFPDPQPAVCHLDHLLAEMKWMRTDFREERRWKAQIAKNLADWCKLYVEASPEVRQHLRIKAHIPPRDAAVEAATEAPSTSDAMDAVPALGHSETSQSEPDTPLEFPPLYSVPPTPPTAIFSLDYDDVVFHLDQTPAADGVLSELPLYEPKPADIRKAETSVPVSRFAMGKLIPMSIAAPRKRSRFDYEEEEEEKVPGPPIKRRQSEVSLFMSPSRRSSRYRDLPPEDSNVALFDPLMRHVRERLHATHAFRPPSEFVMPSTDFFENRTPSQWTWEEDQQLRACVKNFSYNWSLIAMEMTKASQPSKFVAGSERRTPWECFERWVQLEGLPNDMGKTQYFRTYTARLEQAAKTVAQQKAAQQQAQQQAQTPGQIPQTRIKGTQPYRVERRRESRHINMIDAIRKVARKRENALHRQQESARNSQLRKQQQSTENNAVQSRQMHTPAEFSKVRQDRDAKMQEKMELYRLQTIQNQRLAMQQQQQAAQAQANQRAGLPAAIAQQQRAGQGVGTPAQGAAVAQMAAAGNNAAMQRHASQNLMQNGVAANNANLGLGIGSVPQAQMANMQGQQRMVQNNENLRIALAQQQNAMANGGFGLQRQNSANLAAAHLGSPTGGQLTPLQQQQQQQLLNYQAQQARQLQQQQQATAEKQRQLAQHAQNNNASQMGGVNGLNMHGNSTSPRGNPQQQQQAGLNTAFARPGVPGSVVLIKAIQNQIRTRFPQATNEQVMQLAQKQLQAHVAAANTAAAGNNNGGSPSVNGLGATGLTPQQMNAALSSIQNAANVGNFGLSAGNLANVNGGANNNLVAGAAGNNNNSANTNTNGNGIVGMTNGMPSAQNATMMQQQQNYQQQLARHMQQQAAAAQQQQQAQVQAQQAQAQAQARARMSSGSPAGARPGSAASMHTAGVTSAHHSPAMTFAQTPGGQQGGVNVSPVVGTPGGLGGGQGQQQQQQGVGSASRSATPMQ